MDLESILEQEKRLLDEERQLLHEQLHNEPYSFIPTANTNASIAIDNKKTIQMNEKTSLSKKTKDWINQQYEDGTEDVECSKTSLKKKKQTDDMEQWVSDTFYSYFPGFNNEYQKRQNELQKRQRENQENLIKHQMLNNNQTRNKHVNMDASNINSARSNNSSLTSNDANGSLRNSGKNDLEIIRVNNPNYIPSKHSNQFLRPDSARYRLLQDLRHTNLTNLVSDSTEDALETNRRKIEIEAARKKEYQQELIQQIEEKRRNIKLLRDKEHQQEEILTRRLQEQLRTMKLEEQLEKERIKAVKVRFDAEQNRLSREHLLAKLESDSQLITGTDLNERGNKKPATLNSETNKENFSNRQDNRVYKYFSNSGKHDYNYRNKNLTIPTEIDLELEYTEMAKIERECFHLSEKICPMCDEPLKELKNFCLRCQNKISFRIRSPGKKLSEQCKSQKTKSEGNENDNEGSVQHDADLDQSFFLVCVRCERLYSWCKTCTLKSDLCRACQNNRNLCMTCRKTLCSFCLEEVACGRDTESVHINDSTDSFENKTRRKEHSSNEMSYQIINNEDGVKNDNKSPNIASMSANLSSAFNNLDYRNDPPYSLNFDQNSIFHPDHKGNSLLSPNANKNFKQSQNSEDKNYFFYNNDYIINSSERDEKNIERLRKDTDIKLVRYLKNYGELAYQTRGTQTTPTTTARRDIVIQGQHSLSIPLLREMPKMTRKETVFKHKGNSKEMDDLQQRWDIPAVQKYTISPTSPKVVTQCNKS